MAGSFWHSLRAVWVARWQEVAPRLQFWLLLGGYDVRDRSRADIFYVPYLIAFWSVWAFAMFTALSGAVAGLLKALDAATPALAAVQLYFWALLLWAIISLYQATRRSPFVFSAADAALLCQTPVDRRAVALLWFMSDWPRQFLPFAAGGLALGFALFEATYPVEGIDPVTVIGYTGHGLRALGIVLPLHVLILALIWSAGALCLHGRESRPLLRWLPIVVVLIMGLALLSGWWRAAAWPLMAAFGFSAWLPAFLALVIGSLAALALLLSAARALSLSRAAQETSHLHSERYLAHVGAREAAAQLRQARQLGAQSQATRLPARPGLWAIVWKELVRSLRGWRQGLWSWLGVVALSIGLVVAPDWGSRLVTVVFWVQLVARRATATLRDDLTHWWLWRQQPFPAWQLVGGALAPPAALLVLLALLAGVIGARLPFAVDSSWAPLLPLLGVQVALVATWDLLGEIRPDRLLSGEAPKTTVAGLFLALLLAGMELGAVWAVARLARSPWPGVVAGLLLSLVLSVLLARLVANRARRYG